MPDLYEVPKLQDHLKAIQAARISALRRVRLYGWGEGVGILLVLFIGWSLYALYSEFDGVLSAWSTHLLVALAAGALGVIMAPIMMVVLCDTQRDRLRRDVAFSEVRIDTAVGVHDAMREYFHEILPEYSQHLQGFTLAEELFQISTNMSANYDRAFQSTKRALKMLEAHGGVTGIRHEALKAQALAGLLKGLLEILSSHKDVLAATEVDDELTGVVELFERKIQEADGERADKIAAE